MRCMYKLPVLGLSVLMCGLLMGATWFDKDTDEISPTQYSALLGLRDIDPKLFAETLLPLIDTAMQDGKISIGELERIEKAAGSVAARFHAATKEPRLQESVKKVLEKAESQGKSFGDKLGETFTELPKLFDDALEMFNNELKQFKAPKPEAHDGVTL